MERSRAMYRLTDGIRTLKPWVNRTAEKKSYGVYRQYHQYCTNCGKRINALECNLPQFDCDNCAVERHVETIFHTELEIINLAEQAWDELQREFSVGKES